MNIYVFSACIETFVLSSWEKKYKKFSMQIFWSRSFLLLWSVNTAKVSFQVRVIFKISFDTSSEVTTIYKVLWMDGREREREHKTCLLPLLQMLGCIHLWWLIQLFLILSGSNESTWNYDFTPRLKSHSLTLFRTLYHHPSLSHSLTRARLLTSTFTLSVILFVSYMYFHEKIK